MNAPKKRDVIDVLEHLLVSCADGAEGYRHAASEVDNAEIRRLLAHNAAEREAIGCVLTNALVALGHKPAHHGSLPGAVHRRWIDALGAVKSQPTRAILHECQRGEHETIAAFTATLGQDLPGEVLALVQAQLGRVFKASAALNRVALDLEEPS
jgi:uncharacterized protein (TIGR02284 family)